MSTNIATASSQYAHRPQDERFSSPAALIAAGQHDKQYSKEVVYNLRDLEVRAPGSHHGDPHASPTTGTLVLASPKGQAAFTNWSFGQLCRTVKAPAAYLRDLPPAIAAVALNFGLHDAAQAGTTARLLVKANGEAPIIRACTSETYGRVWDVDLDTGIKSMILDRDDKWKTPPTWTPGESAGLYRGDRDSFRIYVNGGSIVTDPTRRNKPDGGQMFRGLMVRNSEVGACSVTIERVLFEYICGNHMLWGAVIDRQYRRRHVGTHVLRDVVLEIARTARDWTQRSAAQDEAIIQAMNTHEIAHTKDAVVDELKALGYSKDDATAAYERCERSFEANPRSFWGIAQGTTSLSQESGYQDDRYVFDQLAAKIMARGAKLVAA